MNGTKVVSPDKNRGHFCLLYKHSKFYENHWSHFRGGGIQKPIPKSCISGWQITFHFVTPWIHLSPLLYYTADVTYTLFWPGTLENCSWLHFLENLTRLQYSRLLREQQKKKKTKSGVNFQYYIHIYINVFPLMRIL